MSREQTRARLAAEVTTLVASAAGAPVVVLGSLPPGGRDLDLLARAGERERVSRALLDGGLVATGSTLVRFGGCAGYAVELIDAESYLAPEPLEDLFRQARPLEGLAPLAEPAPLHALLILARLVEDENRLSTKRRARLERILAADPDAWSKAAEAAAAWGAEPALQRLGHLARGPDDGAPAAWRRARLAAAARRRIRRPPLQLVSFSGIDGSGKSSQARWLHETLTLDLDVDAELIWNDLLGNFALDLVGKPLKWLRRASGRDAPSMANYGDTVSADAAPRATGATREAWASFVTLSNALEQRVLALRARGCGRLAIFDRGPLDLAVRMEILYRTSAERQRRLVELAAARPGLAFYLDIPPEVSLRRKDDVWSRAQLEEHARLYHELAARFGAVRLDGRRPAAELASEIATHVVTRLR